MADLMYKSEIDEVLDNYKNLLALNHLPISSIYLFGSYSKGMQKENSDIDIAVFWDTETLNRFEADVQLLKLTRTIDLRIEPHSFCKGDMDDPDPFLQQILLNGKRLV